MIRRSTAIILVVFVILVFVAWYLQSKGEETSEETVTPSPVVTIFDLPMDAISKVKLEKTNGGRLIMEKDEQGIWSFTEPEGFEINQDEAQTLADEILALNVLSKLEKPPSLEILGLDKPVYRITLTSSNGEDFVMIVGNLTSTSSGYYGSRMGQLPVIVSKQSLDSILGRIDNPPIFVTETPSVTLQITETTIPQATINP